MPCHYAGFVAFNPLIPMGGCFSVPFMAQNDVTLSILESLPGIVLRCFMYMDHYHSPEVAPVEKSLSWRS